MTLIADKLEFIRKELAERQPRNQLRSLKTILPLAGSEVMVNGRKMINFSSNDYLGLSRHPLLQHRATEFMERYGTR